MKLYKDGQLVGEFSTTELKELAGVDIEKAAEVAAEIEAVEDKVFKVGDKVKVVGVTYVGESLYHGENGEITKVWSDGDACVDITGRGCDIYPQSSLKLIEEEPEEVLSYENVKVGELFEVVNNVAQKKFPVGNVVRLMDSLLNDEHSSKFEDVVSGEVGFSIYKEIKRHTPEVLSYENVKIGEYFVVTDSNNYSNAHAFDIGEIVKAKSYADSTTFKAEHMDESDWWYVYYTNVRRATATEIAEATKPKFEIGNAISVNGRFALILSELDSEHEYKIKWYSDGGQTYAGKSYIRHATEEEKSHLQTLIGREQDEYKVGDLVELLGGDGSGYSGREGYIFEVDELDGSSMPIHLKDNGNKAATNSNTWSRVADLKLIIPVEWRHDFVEEVK